MRFLFALFFQFIDNSIYPFKNPVQNIKNKIDTNKAPVLQSLFLKAQCSAVLSCMVPMSFSYWDVSSLEAIERLQFFIVSVGFVHIRFVEINDVISLLAFLFDLAKIFTSCCNKMRLFTKKTSVRRCFLERESSRLYYSPKCCFRN